MNDINPDAPVVLAVRLRQLGDVLATLGTLRAIKQSEPERQIVFVADAHYHELLKNVDFIDLLLPQPPKFDSFAGAMAYYRYVEDLGDMSIEHALDFHSNVRSAVLTFLSGAPVRVGFDVRGRKILYTDVEPRAAFHNGRVIQRTSHESAMALARRCGLHAYEGSVAMTIPVSRREIEEGRHALMRAGVVGESIESGDVIGLNPAKSHPAREWKESAFIEVAMRLVAAGKRVVVLWGPGERERAERIVAASGDGVYLSPERRLDEVPGMLKNVSLLVTINSGLEHLAVAIGVATVSLYGPTHPLEWHLGGERDRVVFAGLSCSPCRLLECPFGSPCMTRLTPDDVLREIAAVDEGVGVA
jgi:ADP-heptose:LPS heptosyltransferase